VNGEPAARVGDKVAHSLALPGALTGLLIGAAIGVAIVATGGLGAIAIGAALATTGGLGLAGQYIGSSIEGPATGAIITGAPTILINYRPAARATLSTASCIEGPPQQEATGAATVLFEMMPAGRKTEMLTCSAKIIEGSPDVIIGGPSVQTLPMEPEVPEWLTTTMQVMAIGGMVIATGGVALTYGVGAALGGLALGFAGSHFGAIGGRWAAQQLGFGETGQRVGEVLGGLVGGMLGGAAGFRGGRAFMNRAIPNPTTPAQGFLRGGLAGRQQVISGRIAQQAAENRAASLRELPRRQQPRATSAAVDSRTGRVYTADSGSPGQNINPTLQQRMPNPSMERWPVDNCAEFQAANRALADGARMEDLVIHTVTVRDGAAFPRCQNCRTTTSGATVTSD
jgi:uncharacterized Zn-binding protein involved in type VI secretion